MNYWWTSDYHFSHFNIIRYCERPFKTAEEMDETIIRKHNERVKPEDTVFFLGDFIFKGGKEGGEERYCEFEKKPSLYIRTFGCPRSFAIAKLCTGAPMPRFLQKSGVKK